MGNLIDLTGKRIGRLTVISKADVRKGGHIAWVCRCDCGNEKIVAGYNLRNNAVKSCGCLLREFAKENGRRNGRLNGMAGSLLSGESSFNALYAGYKRKSYKRNIEFSLDKQSFRQIITKNCFYCDNPPSASFNCRGRNRGGTPFIYNGIDRVDNSKGYILENVVACCRKCNTMKRDITIKMCRKVLGFVDNRSDT